MIPKAERHDPKNIHDSGCKRLCCNGGGRYFPTEDNSPQNSKTSYFKPVMYAIGVIALLSLLTYCSESRKDSQRNPQDNLVHRL